MTEAEYHDRILTAISDLKVDVAKLDGKIDLVKNQVLSRHEITTMIIAAIDNCSYKQASKKTVNKKLVGAITGLIVSLTTLITVAIQHL